MFKVLTQGCEPTRGSKYSACIDLHASHDVTIAAGYTEVVGLGVAINEREMYNLTNRLQRGEYIYADFDDFKSSHFLQLNQRSSLRAKGLMSNTVTIDLDFKDEIKIIIHNPIKMVDLESVYKYELKPYTIKKGDKIAQITLMEHKGHLFDVDTEENRVGGIGSTDKENK